MVCRGDEAKLVDCESIVSVDGCIEDAGVICPEGVVDFNMQL